MAFAISVLVHSFIRSFVRSFVYPSFRQATWLSDFIQGNNARRAAATSKTKKNFFKLCNNAVYGKMAGKQGGRQGGRVTGWQGAKKRKKKSSFFHFFAIFHVLRARARMCD